MASIPSLRQSRTVGPFRIHYDIRNPYSGRGQSPDGVHEMCVVDDYAAAIRRGHAALVEMDWRPLGDRVIPVYVYFIPQGICGRATPAGSGIPPLLELNCIGPEPSCAAARQRRQVTAVHEMTHLFQFEYDPPLRWMWLDEASATAMENHVYPRSTDFFRYLVLWFAYPERSLDSGTGYDCVSFVTYLVRRFGADIIPHIYDAGLGGDTKLEPIAALDAALQSSGCTIASAGPGDVFASGYCADAYFVDDPTSRLHHPKLRRRFADRAVTESFARYPVRDAARDDPVQHLGCRYYSFRLVPGSRALQVTVRPQDGRAREHLRADLYGVDHQFHRLGNARLADALGDGSLGGELPDFTESALDHAVLVVANCAWGQGSADNDDLRFAIHADVAFCQ